ncbi:MAG: site-specific integrase [Leptospirillum sp.]|jgi:integrase
MPPGRDRRLFPGELGKVIECSGSPVLPDIVRFAIETGMSQAEISGMTWQMIDLKKRIVTLLIKKNGDKRIVPLSTEAVLILSGLLRRIDGKVWGITSHAVSVVWRRAVSRPGLHMRKSAKIRVQSLPSFFADLTFHDLRHEATSRLFEKGLNPMQVAAITGHKTLQMLERYIHLKAEDLVELLK